MTGAITNRSETGGDGSGRVNEHTISTDEPTGGNEIDNKEMQKESKVSKLWGKLGLDLGTVLMMMKAGIPPTIALAMYQADAVATTYSTLGYLVAIISILGFCIMPRAKFIQTMALNVMGTCIGAAVGMLMVWSGVQARLQTSSIGGPPQRYNSSQSAVCATWLFFQIWLVNSIKAKFPQLAFPAILYCIFVNVAATYGPEFQTTAQAEVFIQRLIESFLTGFALATGVSLFILPLTCRKVVTKEITGYVTALRGALQAHNKYFESLETTDMFDKVSPSESKDKKKKEELKSPEVVTLKKLMATITALHGKLHGDLPFAKREIAYGKLTPDDFESIFKHLREIMMPLMGLGSLMDLFERLAEIHQFDTDNQDAHGTEANSSRNKAVNDWNDIMKLTHEPFATIIEAMDGGLEHVLLRLQFVKPAKKQKAGTSDTEAKGDIIQPGDKGFAAYLETQADAFYQSKATTLRQWIESKGGKMDGTMFHEPNGSSPAELDLAPIKTRQRNHRQLYMVLYIFFLLHSISRAILDFVRFADEHDQAIAKNKFIHPGKRRFVKWVASVFRSQDSNENDETTSASLESNNTVVHLGDAFKTRKDPEHSPPENAWEKFGNLIRATSRFLRSPESAFGFRCACATMSIAITAFLHDTQQFFLEQRLVWAMIMVAISMTPTAGQSVFTFMLRIIGTIVAMVVALLIWYIPAENTAGSIVLVWVFVSLGFYIPLKRIDLVIVGLISVVTATLIVGYELEVRKIGEALATSNGQPYYKIYILGPYRLATVVGGLAVAFFWTFFPYPITEHSALRQKLGGALYLSANFYSIMHETVMARIRGDEGNLADPTSPGYKLAKVQNKVLAKQMLTLQGLRTHSTMVGWEFPLGGKFPKKEYDAIIQYVANITNYTALLGYASSSFTHPSLNQENDPSSAQWFHDFQKIVTSANITSHEITSLLALLSSSITNGQPLPPYLVAPQSYQISRRLEEVDREILSLAHVAEPGYAALAVIQISTRCINMDLAKLLKAVKGLVGELDFSFHIVSTQVDSETTSTDTLVSTPSHRNKQD
ncbi:hypothetical protein BDV95DRAFT_488880 [Massariosphaeria phaeospora]|uniref:ER transporter 6TM N-terminal domain-containing protein n=1 Tax=Massariosphaeria phaeospora TaxID=100035 RepID=A0A7C8ICS7_9PLEO|nr:hypothetical protein BDV95DRAFT_488880 [Massariosphaeria phaeospora]